MEGSKPVILLYFLCGCLLWHTTSTSILKGLLVILSDLVCGSSCWVGHWDVKSGTRPCSFISIILMSKNKTFYSKSQSWSSLFTPHFLSHTILKIMAFPQPTKEFFLTSHLFSETCFASPTYTLPLFLSNQFLYLPNLSCSSLSFFLFFSFHFYVAIKYRSRIRAPMC